MPDGAALRVGRAEDQAGDAGVADRAGAHGAGLQGDEELEAGQAIVAERLRGGPQGQDLGVGGGIGEPDRPLRAARDDRAGRRVDDDRADRRLAAAAAACASSSAMRMVESSWSAMRPTQARPARRQGRDAGAGERVAKALARAGVASRREVERLIAAGRVA